MLLYRLNQGFSGKGFGQVIIRTGKPAACAVEHAVFARKHDDGRRLEIRVLLDQSASLIAVEAGHHDVDKNHLWPVVADFRQRIESVFREHDFISGLTQEGFSAAPYRVAVIDDEDLDIFRFHRLAAIESI
jgi:hypothetical protein